ncbi:cytochrome P460 family protein [Candidatus Thioglobus sp.]|jgi:hypothetical protein|uniref:cytochrome P460 family protein n=1 Tax=Candidatus Thioglobus sp. TaxID=2026721 RepID=UPI001D6ED29D|nr:cytochrome P460 family protein [Candidatus Thioglobus sp.]MBT3276412.1 hypothetical protein [Candidatus Thioglobus sp.]MBT3446458.1 hypothetical protein [Candidatus Thioglobus sp.]MBT3744375.1 hypothetical protein [Candidatus Thioglobus sp.]MBT4001001.1 hypothetical protein [Candidatus Thioglobus sp.]MBT4315864.1 hypothetical protein [Candidatus Thioglobus sp.]
MKKTIIATLITLSASAFAQTDQEIAKNLFEQLKQKSFMQAPQNLYVGGPPHGPVRAVVEGNINGQRTIVKFNYGGPSITPEKVAKDPKKWLKALTVMQKRPDYDPAHKDWFWAKYKPNGELFVKNSITRAGKDKGCIACHQAASGNDLVFTHNAKVNAEITIVN